MTEKAAWRVQESSFGSQEGIRAVLAAGAQAGLDYSDPVGLNARVRIRAIPPDSELLA